MPHIGASANPRIKCWRSGAKLAATCPKLLKVARNVKNLSYAKNTVAIAGPAVFDGTWTGIQSAAERKFSPVGLPRAVQQAAIQPTGMNIFGATLSKFPKLTHP